MNPENPIHSRPVALITGGSSGIGLATAAILAKHGYSIAICGRSADRLQAARDQVLETLESPEQILTVQLDLGAAGTPQQLFETAMKQFGRIDILVNNAAVAPLAALQDYSNETLDEVINLNIRSVFQLTQLVWKYMLEADGGVIINISSLAAIDPFPGFSLYGSSKAWIDTFTRALGNEGAEHGIRVYSIRPGAVETPMLRGLFPDFPAEECVSPEDIAQAVWNCIDRPESFESGNAYPVTNQMETT